MASERSAFEQWVVTRKFVSGQGKHYVESCLHRDLAGEYTQGWVHGAWVGWQARTSVLVTMPPEIPRYLLGKIVDELFGGAIEDTSPIEDVYRVIAREQPSTAAARDVLAERHRQVNVEGFHGIRDSHYVNYELSKAARAYIEVSWHALSTGIPCAKPKSWPWMDGFKWSDGRTMLVKAGALILAEIERLDRAEQAKQQEQQP
ncbi:hypothetical protein CO724_17500 [Ectopseudomonas mendocina]|nr:hypothetical protein CO724_17500 [Pseudomonas mendocina]